MEYISRRPGFGRGALAAAALAAGLAFGAGSASAAIFSTTLGAGISKDNPDTDGTSIYGASLAGSVLSFDTVSGQFRAEIFNAGEGIITGVAFDLNDSIFGGSYGDAIFSANYDVPPANCPGCLFSGGLPDPQVEDGFGSFDIGAAAEPPPSQTGIESGETAIFFWDFGGLGLDFSGITSFQDVIETHSVDLDPGHPLFGEGLNVFWVAMIQELGEGGEFSDHVGGQVTNGNGNGEVPEPSAMALMGIGLLGLGLAVRRRQRRA